MMNVHSINSSFPKIDNLEYFPLKVLFQIFTNVSDIDLLHLSETSYRFENITKMVIKQRYAHNYFVLQDYGRDVTKFKKRLEKYTDFFQRFGNEIESIETESVFIFEESHWISSLLNTAKNLQKLKLKVNGKYLDENLLKLLKQHANITHLTLNVNKDLGSSIGELVFPAFHNLKELQLINHAIILFESFEEVIRNNSTLESLYIGDSNIFHRRSQITKSYPFDKLIAFVGAHLNQLKEFAYVPAINEYSLMWPALPSNNMRRISDQILDSFVDSLYHLDSLALSIVIIEFFTDYYDLLQRLASRCKNIKRLRLNEISGHDIKLFKIVQTFAHNVESLILSFFEFGTEFLSVFDHFLVLKHLEISIAHHSTWSFVLELLERCPSLEKITLRVRRLDSDFEDFKSIEFYNAFIKIGKPNAKIEVIDRGNHVVASVKKDEVIWGEFISPWVYVTQQIFHTGSTSNTNHKLCESKKDV